MALLNRRSSVQSSATRSFFGFGGVCLSKWSAIRTMPRATHGNEREGKRVFVSSQKLRITATPADQIATDVRHVTEVDHRFRRTWLTAGAGGR